MAGTTRGGGDLNSYERTRRGATGVVVALVAALSLGVGAALQPVVAQGTSYLSRTFRIGAATPYNLTWPADDGAADGILQTDGSGALTWATLDAGAITTGALASARGGVPANAVIFLPATSCPTGYTEYTTLRGRYAVGLVANGTSAATVGTALTNTENRAVGQHTHTQNAHNHGITDAGHTHTYNEHGGSTSAFTETGTVSGNGSQNTGNSTTGITINNRTATNQNTGSVTGTNAPYVQLLACQKQ